MQNYWLIEKNDTRDYGEYKKVYSSKIQIMSKKFSAIRLNLKHKCKTPPEISYLSNNFSITLWGNFKNKEMHYICIFHT